jgi:hypothetical protein
MRSFDCTIRIEGDLYLVGTMQSGSVPAARVDSGILAVARSWAYTGGDVTSSAGSAVLTIANNAVTNAKLADMAAGTFKMRLLGTGSGDPVDGTPANAKFALQITTSDVSGLGTMATQNANSVNISGGFANYTTGLQSSSSSGTAAAIENTGSSFTGDVVIATMYQSTPANCWIYSAYDGNAGVRVGGIRGDGAVLGKTFYVTALARGTVNTTIALDLRNGFTTWTMNSTAGYTITVANAPPGPGLIALKFTAPAAGTAPTMTYPATFKGSWPTAAQTLGRYTLALGYYDGTNYNYVGGSTNVV